MSKFNPKVSIIIPVHNGSNYMREAIDSALNQTYKNIETIVINDGSKAQGATESIALSYGNKIRYIYQENGGICAALNNGIAQMEGDYFSWLSHDALYKPEKIEKQIELLEEYGIPAVVTSNYEHVSQTGELIGNFEIPQRGVKSIRGLLGIGGCPGINGCTLLIPREYLLNHGTFNPQLKALYDYDLWFRLASKVPFIHVNQSLIILRQHEEQNKDKKRNLRTAEHDSFIVNSIKQLTDKEIENFLENSSESLYGLFNYLLNNSYVKAPIIILKLIYKFACKDIDIDKALALLDKYIFKLEDEEKIRIYWEKYLKQKTFPNKEKPLLLFYTYCWRIGGIPRLIATLMDKFIENYDIILVTSDRKNIHAYKIPNEVRHLRLAPNNFEELSWRLTSLSVILDIDLFIGQINILPELLPVYKMLEEFNIKSIACNNYNYYLPYMQQYMHNLIPNRLEYFKHASAAAWLTSFCTKVYSRSNNNGAYLPLPASFEETESMPQFGKTIVSVGRFEDYLKRIDLTLEAFKLVLKKHPDAHLIIVGNYDKDITFPPNYNETLEQILSRLDISDENIEFTGPSDNVQQYYSKASLIIMTSSTEAVSLVLLEAASFGVPAVAFDVPGLEDIIFDGINGFSVPYENIKEMAEKISLLLSDKDMHKNMCINAKKILKKFNKDKSVEKWNKLAETVISSVNQEELEKKLLENFSAGGNDTYEFSQRMSREFEKHIGIMQCDIKNMQKNKTKQIPESATVDTDKKNQHGEKELSARTAAIKANMLSMPLILIRDLFRSLRDDELKTTLKKIQNKIGLGD